MSPSQNFPTVTLPSGERVAALGQGTWNMGQEGESGREWKKEVAALRLGLELGMKLIDTAEIYGDGLSERLVADAIEGRRDQAFIVTKVSPDHASRAEVVEACERSLERLRSEWIDLYLLHWPSEVPFEETLAGFQDLLDAGKIRSWGVSNFDVAAMKEIVQLTGGNQVAANQVLYNLESRAIEWELLPWCWSHRVPVMAYTPLGEPPMLANRVLQKIAQAHRATPRQIALAWLLNQPGIIAIPKASHPEHVRENHKAIEIRLTPDELDQLDRAFPPPSRAIDLQSA